MMTKLESYAKYKIQDILNEQGYPTYSKLLDIFDINLTSDPKVIGYMEPGKGRIVLNKLLDMDSVSLVVRHEILHEYLNHMVRAQRHLKRDSWDSQTQKVINKAADFEISNRGYTDADKRSAKSIKLDKKTLQGLVTDIDHPEWVDYTLEQMLDELTDEINNQNDQIKDEMAQIGDKGDEALQDAEQAAREAKVREEQANDAKEAGKSSKNDEDSNTGSDSDSGGDSSVDSKGNSDASNLAKSLQKEINDAASNIENELGGGEGGLFSRDKDKVIDAEQAKIDKIRKILRDSSIFDRLIKEVDAIKNKDDLARAAKDAASYRNNPLTRFVDSINNFIKNETAYGRNRSYGKINKTYANTPIIKPGINRRSHNKVPSINVYFDVSGSWTEDKINIGKRAVATLNKYVNKGKLIINLWYFSTEIHSDMGDSTGGTAGQPILNHILSTKPDNVIIMTDSDIDDCHTDVTVPGAVWFLFVNGVSENLKNHLHGLKMTKEFLITPEES